MQITEHDSIQSKKSYQLWCKCMKLGERTGCHQLAERSLFFKSYQMPVCARCTGVIIGYLLAFPSYILFGFRCRISCFSCLCMLIDWSLQACRIKPSTNKRRLITGVLGGFGIMSIQLGLVMKLLSQFNHFLNLRRGGRSYARRKT